MRQGFGILIALFALLLSACAGGGGVKPGAQRPAPVAPGDTAPRSKYGNPESYEVYGETYRVLPTARGYSERGQASWYGEEFHGKRTSSGEPYNMHAMTAAHRTLPLPSYVRVTNLQNRREIIVRVNDRGPFHSDRIIDLSFAAASELDILRNGTAEVEVTAVDPVLAAAETEPRSSRPARTAAPVPSPAPASNAKAPADQADGVLAPDEMPVSMRRSHAPGDTPVVVVTELPGDETLTAAAPPPAPVAVDLSTQPAPAAGHFLQAGAFSLAKNANALVERLRSAGFTNVDVYPSGGILKVRLGPYRDIAALQPDRERLDGLGIRAYPVEE
jgi:rare lipoprotein A